MRQKMTQKTTATLQRCNASNVRLVKNRPFHRRKSTFASFMAKQKEAQKIRKYMHKTAKIPPNRHLFRSPPTVILYLINAHSHKNARKTGYFCHNIPQLWHQRHHYKQKA